MLSESTHASFQERLLSMSLAASASVLVGYGPRQDLKYLLPFTSASRTAPSSPVQPDMAASSACALAGSAWENPTAQNLTVPMAVSDRASMMAAASAGLIKAAPGPIFFFPQRSANSFPPIIDELSYKAYYEAKGVRIQSKGRGEMICRPCPQCTPHTKEGALSVP